MDKSLVSIIIPVHNCETYIEECLNSIVNQTYKNIEIVVVDDGSTDRTFDICTNFQKTHPEIILKTQANKGVSSARNSGIESSKGEYVCFVDADDFIPTDYVSGLIENAREEIDFTCCNYSMFENIGLIKDRSKDITKKTMDKDEMIGELLLGNNILGTPWGKLFKRSIIKEGNIIFDEGLKVCEDLLFCIQYAIKANNNIYTAKPTYFYRKNEGSFNARMKSKWDDIYLQRIDVIERIGRLLNDNGLSSEVKKPLKYQIYFSNTRVFEYLCASTEKEQKRELKKKTRRVIRKYNYLYIWYMFKTKNFKKANIMFFTKNILRGFGYNS